MKGRFPCMQLVNFHFLTVQKRTAHHQSINSMVEEANFDWSGGGCTLAWPCTSTFLEAYRYMHVQTFHAHARLSSESLGRVIPDSMALMRVTSFHPCSYPTHCMNVLMGAGSCKELAAFICKCNLKHHSAAMQGHHSTIPNSPPGCWDIISGCCFIKFNRKHSCCQSAKYCRVCRACSTSTDYFCE